MSIGDVLEWFFDELAELPRKLLELFFEALDALASEVAGG